MAHIAYVDRRGLPYIVPITYAYDGRALYGYSLLGAKIENMGVHPDVCVEVERIRNVADWCSVVLRGTFETLHGAAAIEAVTRISTRLSTAALSAAAPAVAAKTYVEREGGPGIAYRILIAEKHGRCSSPPARSPAAV